MLKLRRLRVQKYRIVKPGTELHFHDRVNLLLGLNGTGKTTLLDLIARALGGHFKGLEDEDFAFDYDIEVSAGLIRVEIENQRLELAPEKKKPRGAMGGLPASYRLVLTFQPSAAGESSEYVRRIEWDAEKLLCTFSGGMTEHLGGGAVFEAPSTFTLLRDLFQAFGLRSGYMEELFGPAHSTVSRLDESIDWLRALLEHDTVDVATRSDEDVSWRSLNARSLSAAVLLPWLFKAADADSKGRTVSAAGTDLPLLTEIAAALGHREVSLTLDLQSSEPLSGAGKRHGALLSFGNQRFLFTKRDGTILPLERLSFGQKRLVAFIYYLAVSPNVVIADELANGLHHAMIGDCFRRMGERQAFLATQNPLIMDFVDFESAEDIRASLIRCRCDSQGAREEMVWSHLSPEDAAEVFADYSVGIQHTHEILKVRGLW